MASGYVLGVNNVHGLVDQPHNSQKQSLSPENPSAMKLLNIPARENSNILLKFYKTPNTTKPKVSGYSGSMVTKGCTLYCGHAVLIDSEVPIFNQN